MCHSGDGESHTVGGERFEHPTKTWACATHKQFTMVAVAIAKATWNWVRGKCEEAMREVLGAALSPRVQGFRFDLAHYPIYCPPP